MLHCRAIIDHKFIGFIFGCCMLLCDVHATLCVAQMPAGTQATVQAFGEDVVELKPKRLRLLLDTKAEGATAREATESLSKHKQAVREELVALKADRDSIRMMPADITSRMMGLPKQYERLNSQALLRLLGNTLNFNIEELPIVYTAHCYIEAEWELPSTDPDMLLQLPNTLREEIKSRDLLGEDNVIQLSAEQNSRVSQLKTAMDEHMGFYEDESAEDNRVQILFVAKMSAEERAGAMKRAYEHARQQCEELAQAANMKLGRLANLSKATPDEVSGGFTFSSAAEDPDSMVARQLRSGRRDETSAKNPDLLFARIQLRVSFTVDK